MTEIETLLLRQLQSLSNEHAKTVSKLTASIDHLKSQVQHLQRQLEHFSENYAKEKQP